MLLEKAERLYKLSLSQEKHFIRIQKAVFFKTSLFFTLTFFSISFILVGHFYNFYSLLIIPFYISLFVSIKEVFLLNKRANKLKNKKCNFKVLPSINYYTFIDKNLLGLFEELKNKDIKDINKTVAIDIIKKKKKRIRSQSKTDNLSFLINETINLEKISQEEFEKEKQIITE